MLMKIDSVLCHIPSKTINLLTLGRKGQSMCGRLHLYQKNTSSRNVVVNTLIFIIDLIEPNHCRLSARLTAIKNKHIKPYNSKKTISEEKNG